MSKRSATSSHIGGLHDKSSASSTKSSQEAKSEDKSSYRKNLRPRPAKPVDYRGGIRSQSNKQSNLTSRTPSEAQATKGHTWEATAPKRHCPDNIRRNRSLDLGEKVKGSSSSRSKKSSSKGWAPFIQPAQSSDSEEDSIDQQPPTEPTVNRTTTKSRNLASRLPKKQSSTSGGGGGGRKSSSTTEVGGEEQQQGAQPLVGDFAATGLHSSASAESTTSKGTKSKAKGSGKRAGSGKFSSFSATRSGRTKKQLPPPQDQPEDLSVKSKSKKRCPAQSAASGGAAGTDQQQPEFELRTKESHISKTGSCASTRCRKARGKRAQSQTARQQQEQELQQQQSAVSATSQSSRRQSQQQQQQQLSSFHQDLSLPSANNQAAGQLPVRAAASQGSSSSIRSQSLNKQQQSDRKYLPGGAASNHPLGTDVESFLIPQHYGGRVLESLNPSIAYENQLTAAGASADAPGFLLRTASLAASATGGSNMSSSGGMGADSDHDESDMSRLQALLEARNMPIPASTLLNNLGPRIQQMLHRPPTSGASSKASQLLDVMKSTDESRQLQAVIEMCQILVMGNEDTLTGFPIRAVVPLLINLLKVEHNFDMMNHACRAISYMMEALPRSSGVIVQAIPVLLQKLQSIQCMDVAEQSLSALEQLSRQHSPAILSEDGFNACLLFLEFFSLPAQRNALKVAANCCCCSPVVASGSLSPNQEFQKFFASSIPMLVQKLSHHDKKCLESICLCFARLVDLYHSDVATLKQLGEYQLLENFQNLLVVTPPLIGSHTFVMVIKTMYQICSPCPELANRLVRNNIAETLQCLLCGSTLNLDSRQPVVILSRSPQELYEITALIRELMPKLPTNETVFSVDSLLSSTPLSTRALTSGGKNVWQWQNNSGEWKNYTKTDSRKIEGIRLSSRQECNLLINNRAYTIDFTTMQQVNDDTDVARPVRKIADTSSTGSTSSTAAERAKTPDLTRSKNDFNAKDKEIIAQLVRSLSKLLYEVFSTSAGSPPVRQNCVFALKKMIYYAEPELLNDMLKDVNISSNLTSMLSSSSLDMIAAALQIAILLMEKLFDQYQSLFQRQGVVYQVAKLLEPNNKIVCESEPPPPPPVAAASSSSSSCATASAAAAMAACYTSTSIENFKELMQSSSSASREGGTSDSSDQHFAYHQTRNEAAVASHHHKEKKHALRISKKKPTSSRSSHDMGKSSSRSSNRNKGASTSSSASSVPAAHSSNERIISPPLSKAKSSSTAAASSMSTTTTGASSATTTPGAAAVAFPTSKSSRTSSHKNPAANLLTNIQPPWGKMLGNHPHMFPPGPFGARKSYVQHPHLKRFPLNFPPTTSAGSSMQKINTSSRRQEIDRKIKTWIREQAGNFLQKYFPNAYPSSSSSTSLAAAGESSSKSRKSAATTAGGSAGSSSAATDHTLLSQLTSVASVIDGCKDIVQCTVSIKRLRDVVTSSDASPFELQHSGVIGALLRFLTATRSTIGARVTSRRRRHGDHHHHGSVASSNDGDPPVGLPVAASGSEHSMIDQSSVVGGDNLATADQSTTAVTTLYDEEGVELTSSSETVGTSSIESIAQYDRLRCFLHVFADLPMEEFSAQPVDFKDLLTGNDDDDNSGDVTLDGSRKMLRELVRKLNMCVGQLEQLPVKLHDVSAVGNRSEALSYFTRNQLKCHLQRHPESPKLKQWPGGAVRVDPLAMVSAIEKYLVNRGYSVPSTGTEDDLRRGHHALALDDDESEDEIDETYEQGHPISSSSATSHGSSAAANKQRSSSASTGSNSQSHRLELSINGHPLQTNMTVYQAIKMFSRDGAFNSSGSSVHDRSFQNFSSDTASSAFWNMTHIIHYKHVPVEAKSMNSRKSGRSGSRQSKRVTFSWSTGKLVWRPSHINDYVKKKFQIGESALANDPGKEVLSLLKVIYGLSKHWYMLYSPTTVKTTRCLLPPSEFVINKLSAKCTRQVQDPLMIMTGEIPSWVGELARTFPFVLPFETRQIVFRVVAFDRDRAMHYLIDSGKMNEINSSNSTGAPSSSNSYGHHDSSSRFTSSKVEKKKYVVKRENLLVQAEKLMSEHAHQKHIIEVQYDGEVGTGLGPTQEFYTLAGNELQRSDLLLWRNDQYGKPTESSVNMQQPTKKPDGEITDEITGMVEEPTAPPTTNVEYIHSSVGLFPRPTAKSNRSNPHKNLTKFRFLGRLLAKALMDNRLIDLPLSPVFYKWLLGQDNAISWHDLEMVDRQMSMTFFKLMSVLHQREIFAKENRQRLAAEDCGGNTECFDINQSLSSSKIVDVDLYDENKQKQNASLTVDGCSVEDLSLDFQLPGFPDIEMMKNGSKTSLSLENIDKYLNLFAYWTLHEGIRHQMEAVRSGFNSVLPITSLEYFYPEELDQLFCGARFCTWTEQELADACRTDHGYTLESETVKYLFAVLAKYDSDEQRRFLQFVTGSPHLPIGGLRAMNPPLTLVRKTFDEGRNPDEYLPSVMTCVNYLKIPEYSCKSILEQRFCKAVHEGQQSFQLS